MGCALAKPIVLLRAWRDDGYRGVYHRARIRATRWLNPSYELSIPHVAVLMRATCLLGQSSAIRNGGLRSCEDYRTRLVGKPKDEDLGSHGAALAWWKVDHGDHALAAKVLDGIVLCNPSSAFLQTYAGPEVDYQSVGWISCLREGHGLADGPGADVHFKEVFERNFRSGGRRWIVSDVHRCSTAIWTERHYSDNAPAKKIRLLPEPFPFRLNRNGALAQLESGQLD